MDSDERNFQHTSSFDHLSSFCRYKEYDMFCLKKLNWFWEIHELKLSSRIDGETGKIPEFYLSN